LERKSMHFVPQRNVAHANREHNYPVLVEHCTDQVDCEIAAAYR